MLRVIDREDAGAVPANGAARSEAPAWWPTRWYYAGAMVRVLGLTATASYGILLYALAAFIVPMGAELGWSKTEITSAFSVAQLLAGVASIPVSRWVDRHGARGLMTAGSLLATLLLVALAQVQSLTVFCVVWALMGGAMAAVLYEPAFVVIATWFRVRRNRGCVASAIAVVGATPAGAPRPSALFPGACT